ncbi:MAG: HEAT repeat domain-containing protein, partial [Bradymonadaceae bacterium]
MNRKSIVSALVAMALAFPVTGWAESAAEKSPEEKRTEVRGYAEEYKEHADPTVRTAAILALGQTAKREDRAELEALKAADSDRVRLAAGMALVLSEDGKAANFTATLLRDSTTLFVTLRDVISVLPASHQTQIINELLKDATTEIRRDVFRYLAEQRGPLYELLGGSLLDANEEIRAQAIQALRASERSDALAFASTMLGNRTEAIRSDGLRLTDTIRKHPRAAAEVTALLEKALQDRIPAVQLEAARQLVYLKNPKGTAALVDSLEGAPAEDRVRTIRVLLENEVRPPLAPLKPLIESSEDKEEKALLYELAAASRDAEMFATLKTMFSSEDFDERIIAVRSLGRTKNPAAGELLARGLFEGRPEIRRYSARGLGHLESEASLAVLRRA